MDQLSTQSEISTNTSQNTSVTKGLERFINPNCIDENGALIMYVPPYAQNLDPGARSKGPAESGLLDT